MSSSNYDLTYLSIDSIQEGVGASQIVPLIIGLSQQGKKISLTTFEKSAPSIELVETLRSNGIHWTPQEFGQVGALGGLNRLRTIKRTIPKSDVIHGRSDIPTAAAVFSNSDAPILWDVRSLWSDQRKQIATPGWNAITARAARLLETVSARNATAMTTLTAAVVPILEKRHRKLPKIRAVIPTCVQIEKFALSPLPLGQVTCLLSGTFNNYYDLNETKRILDEIRKGLDLRVVWARGGEAPSSTLGVGEDSVISATYAEMPGLVSSAHFGIAVCKQENLESLAAAVPTKIAEFLASGRPVIVSGNIGDLDLLVKQYRVGVVIEHGQDLSQIESQLRDLLSDPTTPDRCRALALEHFDMDKAVTTYMKIYEEMLRGSGN